MLDTGIAGDVDFEEGGDGDGEFEGDEVVGDEVAGVMSLMVMSLMMIMVLVMGLATTTSLALMKWLEVAMEN
jgi:hypothetical protein